MKCVKTMNTNEKNLLPASFLTFTVISEILEKILYKKMDFRANHS